MENCKLPLPSRWISLSSCGGCGVGVSHGDSLSRTSSSGSFRPTLGWRGGRSRWGPVRSYTKGNTPPTLPPRVPDRPTYPTHRVLPCEPDLRPEPAYVPEPSRTQKERRWETVPPVNNRPVPRVMGSGRPARSITLHRRRDRSTVSGPDPGRSGECH